MRVFRRHPHWRLPVAIVLAGLIGIAVGGVLYVHPTFGGGKATAAALPTSIQTRTIPGHTVTRLKKVRVRVVKYRHGKRVVSYRTVTRPVSVFVPPHTVEVTGPGRTVVRTTVRTVRLPGTTRTETVIHTTTLPATTVTGPTITNTATETTIVTGPTTTVTCIVDTNGTTIGGC